MVLLSALIVVALFVAAGFYAGAETGMYALSRLRLRFRAARGDRNAKVLARLLADPVGFICMTLVGHNAAVYGITIAFTHLAERWVSGRYAEFVAAAVLAFPVFALADVTPKNIFRSVPAVLMYNSAFLLWASHILFSPFVVVLRAIGYAWGRLLGGSGGAEGRPSLGSSLLFLLADGASRVRLTDHQRFLAWRIIGLSQLAARDIMIKWDQVLKLRGGYTGEDILMLARQSGRSRFVVVDTSGDPVATVSVFDDVFGVPESARSLTRVDAGLSVLDALRELQRAHSAIAVVTQDGAPAGIVSLKDLVETITGELTEW